MSNLNLCVVEGTLKSKPNYLNEDKIIRFDINVNRKHKTNVLTIHIIDSRLADVCMKYLSAGSHVLITGINHAHYIEGREVKFLPDVKKKEVNND